MTPRPVRFAAVGLLGFAVQLVSLWALTSPAGWKWLPATVVSVELAVVHNYLWHARWTWRDRGGPRIPRFARFQSSTGVLSLLGNVMLMALFASAIGLPAVIANALTVTVIAVLNFLIADRWVFRRSGPRLAVLTCAACVGVPAHAGAQSAETLNAWDRYVTAVEARLDRSWTRERVRGVTAAPPTTGASIAVPSGTISDWSGSVFVPGITVDELLHRLWYPGTPPPQDDVVSSRVLARTDDSLRVSIRLVRRMIVSVTYDTEHEIRFRRVSDRLATARSVATRVQEVGGDDRGWLWRLHSYWRYEEIGGGVLVSLESLALSRSVPTVIRPVATPLIARIASESVERTLDALRRYCASTS